MRGLIAGLADTDRFTLASQLAVLRNCPEALSKLIRNGDMVLLAAKVLVISRLLHKKLSQRRKPPPYLDILKIRLANLRRKLLDKIDRRFQALELTGTALIEAMCAFSLATSSSAVDVLRHFHHIRLEAMAHQVQKNDDNWQDSCQALKVYIKTLKDTKTYLPGQLATALQNLKTLPLCKNRDLQALIELNLEAHEQWVSDDIKMFTPYVRHDDLSKSEASRSLKEWAEHASSSFFVGLRNQIKLVDNFAVIMQLRTQLLQLWLSNSQHSLGFEVSEVLDGIRNAFNARCTWLIKAQTKSLDDLAVAAGKKLEHWQKSQPKLCTSLWDSSIASMDLTDGGKAFTNTLLDRSTGRNEALMAISIDYRAWLERIEKIEQMIFAMRKIRWEDVADEADANDDPMDKQVLLSEEDPQLLQDKLRECLNESFLFFSNSVRTMASKISGPDGGPKAVYLLRIWREIRHKLPSTFENPQYLGLDSINSLHDILATSAIHTPLETCEKRLKKWLHGKTLLGRPLWEGTPELPVLPSSWTFRLLTELISSMAGLGVDIWSPRATNVLKRKLKVQLEAVFRNAMATPIMKEKLVNGDAAINKPTENREKEKPEANQDEEKQQEQDPKEENPAEIEACTAPQQTPILESKIQLLFDLLYLSHAFIPIPSPGEDNGVETNLSIVGETGLSEGSVKRIRRVAEGYWKRSCVLFGLLGS